ncbi:MAG TPA: hypothetical protein VHN59_06065 [Chitinophagaceae bacterium]|nr:hypothetical protein [Chitinophagaceae bacterium]
MEIKYQQFWDWFVQNRTLFAGTEITDQSIELIDQRINILGEFAWEIGPGQLKTTSLTISPGGDRDLLPTTKEIISYAPTLPDWEFHYAKPVKEWENYFNVMVNDQKIGINISKWEYTLSRYDTNIYDIRIKLVDVPVTILAEKDQALYGIVEMVLESIIGEEKRLERINEIEIVKEDVFKKQASSILHLKQHIDSLP